jgi:tripartite-type tricarboxylate transporter receptor subunit TctC
MLGALKSILAVLFLLSTGVAHAQAYPTKPVRMHNALVVSPTSPLNSVKDLIAVAKAKPGQLSYGSGGGSGSSDHLAGELFRLMASIDVLHVP